MADFLFPLGRNVKPRLFLLKLFLLKNKSDPKKSGWVVWGFGFWWVLFVLGVGGGDKEGRDFRAHIWSTSKSKVALTTVAIFT